MDRARVTAFDSGKRVVVELDPKSKTPVSLGIGEDEGSPDVDLSVEEAQRVIDALTEGLARLSRLHAGDARD